MKFSGFQVRFESREMNEIQIKFFQILLYYFIVCDCNCEITRINIVVHSIKAENLFLKVKNICLQKKQFNNNKP